KVREMGLGAFPSIFQTRVISDAAVFLGQVRIDDLADEGAGRRCHLDLEVNQASLGFLTIFGTKGAPLGGAAWGAPDGVPCAPVELGSKFGHSKSLTTVAGIRINLDDHAVAAMAESIAMIGLLNPIRVRKVGDGFEVIAGA